MPSSSRRVILSALVGFALAVPMVALGLWFNVARLAEIVMHSDRIVLSVILLWAAIGMILSAVQHWLTAIDVSDDEDDEGPGGGLRQYELRTIPIRSDDRRRH